MKKLNWSGFFFVWALCLLAAASNKSVGSVLGALFLGSLIGIPFGALFLWEGRDR